MNDTNISALDLNLDLQRLDLAPNKDWRRLAFIRCLVQAVARSDNTTVFAFFLPVDQMSLT